MATTTWWSRRRAVRPRIRAGTGTCRLSRGWSCRFWTRCFRPARGPRRARNASAFGGSQPNSGPRTTTTRRRPTARSRSWCWSRNSAWRKYGDRVEHAIVGFHLDAQGEWVAELACGHQQHVRHLPPFHLRPWVLEAEGRRQRLGTPLECRLCDQDVAAPTPSTEAGGEAACLAPLLCPDCGVVLGGSLHRPGCASAA